MAAEPTIKTESYERLSSDAQSKVDRAVATLYQNVQTEGIDLAQSIPHVLEVIEAVSRWAIVSGNKKWLRTTDDKEAEPTRAAISTGNVWLGVPRNDPLVYMQGSYIPYDKA